MRCSSSAGVWLLNWRVPSVVVRSRVNVMVCNFSIGLTAGLTGLPAGPRNGVATLAAGAASSEAIARSLRQGRVARCTNPSSSTRRQRGFWSSGGSLSASASWPLTGCYVFHSILTGIHKMLQMRLTCRLVNMRISMTRERAAARTEERTGLLGIRVTTVAEDRGQGRGRAAGTDDRPAL